MKAVILAAGCSRRMGFLTSDTHKSLLCINEKPILGHILDSLFENNISEIIVVLGYQATDVKAYCINEYSQNFSFSFVYNNDFMNTNNVYSLYLALNSTKMDSSIILIESDLIFDKQIITDLLNNKNENVAVLDSYRKGMDGTVVELKDDIVCDLILSERQSKNFNLDDKYKTLNIYKFSRYFIEKHFLKLLEFYVNNVNRLAYYEAILGIIIHASADNIHAQLVNGKSWAEVDDSNDINQAEFKFNTKDRKTILSKSFGGLWNYDILDFYFIRNMYFPPPGMIAQLKNSIPDVLYSYGSSLESLIDKFSFYFNRNDLNLIPLNGAAQIYPVLQNYFKKMRIAIPNPGFGEYRRIFPEATTFDSFLVDKNIETLENLILSSKIDVVVLINPNNPTGKLIASTKLQEFILRFPSTFFIIDESFIDFSNDPGLTNLLANKSTQNIILIKSLSKIIGVPGLRLGYCITNNAALLEEIKRSVGIWHLNSIAEFFLEVALKFRGEFSNSILKTIDDRENFYLLLKSQSWCVNTFKSEANFILVETIYSLSVLEKLSQILLEDFNIYIKTIKISRPGIDRGYIRFAVRTMPENTIVLKVINDACKKLTAE